MHGWQGLNKVKKAPHVWCRDRRGSANLQLVSQGATWLSQGNFSFFLGPPFPGRSPGSVRTYIFLKQSRVLGRFRPGSGGECVLILILAQNTAGLSVAVLWPVTSICLRRSLGGAAAPRSILGDSPPPPDAPEKNPDFLYNIYQCGRPPKCSWLF